MSHDQAWRATAAEDALSPQAEEALQELVRSTIADAFLEMDNPDLSPEQRAFYNELLEAKLSPCGTEILAIFSPNPAWHAATTTTSPTFIPPFFIRHPTAAVEPPPPVPTADTTSTLFNPHLRVLPDFYHHQCHLAGNSAYHHALDDDTDSSISSEGIPPLEPYHPDEQDETTASAPAPTPPSTDTALFSSPDAFTAAASPSTHSAPASQGERSVFVDYRILNQGLIKLCMLP